MIRRSQAYVFNKFMSSGRTSPILLSTTPDGDHPVDFVVKLNGGMDAGTSGAVCEFVASAVASRLNIRHPEPGLVFISDALADVVISIHPDKAALMKKSVGWNFGTRHMKNLTIWTVDQTVTGSLVDAASDIFAFDALIQNPDRTYKNPNLGVYAEALHVFDHECAFSFLYSIVTSRQPWELNLEHYLNDHVFMPTLRKRKTDWKPLLQLLAGIDTSFFSELLHDIPAEWNTTGLPRIERHLLAVRDHSHEFELELQRRCA